MPWLDSQPLCKSKQPPPFSQDLSSFMENTRTTPGPRTCQDLLDCVAVLVTGLLQAPTSLHHQPTTLSASFAEPTITSPSLLNSHSIPQVPPSQPWGIKGSPTAATWGLGAPGPRQRAGASPGEPYQDSSVSPGLCLVLPIALSLQALLFPPLQLYEGTI